VGYLGGHGGDLGILIASFLLHLLQLHLKLLYFILLTLYRLLFLTH
jgi:hypothetical protein